MFDRIDALIGSENRSKLEGVTVAVIGLGGVGGTCFECLVRSGISNIIVVDKDEFEESNLNRQILSSTDTLNKYKTDVAVEYAKKINPDINVVGYHVSIANNNLDILTSADYIIDAIDDIPAKVELIKYADKKSIKIISCMGMGKRIDPSKVCITTLDKTSNDPLARKLRQVLRKENISLNIPVVTSLEDTINNNVQISSMIFVPSTAGILLSNWVVMDIINYFFK